MTTSNLIPPTLMGTKTFSTRLHLLFDLEKRTWSLDPSLSEATLDEKMQAWVDAERPDIRFISPPSHSVYNVSPTEQIMLMGIALLYVPAVQGADRAQPVAATKKPMAKVVVPVKPGSKSVSGVFEPPG
jgi:hypothetical protein